MRRALIASAVLILLLVGLAFWDTTEDGSAGQAVPGGHTDAGRQAIAEFGCGTCHTIPGVTAADGRVGPPLVDFASRTTIAGKLPNTPPDLVRWIMHPQAIEPGTDMPDLGVPLRGARDIAAYLLTLGSPRFPYHLAG